MKLLYPFLTFVSGMLLFFAVQVQAFVLCLKTDKLEYTLGEPVVLYVSLQNTENISVELPRLLEPNYYEVEYTINGKRFIPSSLIDDLYPIKTFAPGEIIREEVDLTFNGKKWLFPNPGNYTITATLYGQASNNLTIVVQSPNGSKNREQLKQASQLLLEIRKLSRLSSVVIADFSIFY